MALCGFYINFYVYQQLLLPSFNEQKIILGSFTANIDVQFSHDHCLQIDIGFKCHYVMCKNVFDKGPTQRSTLKVI